MPLDIRAEEGAEDVVDAFTVALEDAAADADKAVEEATPDVVTLVGTTRFFLHTLAKLPPDRAALLVSAKGPGALAEVPMSEVKEAAQRLVSGTFWQEPLVRAEVTAGEDQWTLINEAALLPSLNGSFLSYELRVDDELLWRDRADGVLIATPTGSTAYARSAGGAVMLAASKALQVVPVCSEEHVPPLVVPEDARVTVGGPRSQRGLELMVDGQTRVEVHGDVEARVAPPVSVVRFRERRHAEVLTRLRLRKESPRQVLEAPPSARFVYKLLEYEGPLSPTEIARISALSPRTVRHAVEALRDAGLVLQRPSLRDARSHVVEIRSPEGLPRTNQDGAAGRPE